MTINIEIEYVERIENENKELNEFINHVKELSSYHERKKLEYKEVNEKLKQQNETLEQDKKAIYSIWKKAMNRENNLIEENKQLKQELFNLYLKHYN